MENKYSQYSNSELEAELQVLEKKYKETQEKAIEYTRNMFEISIDYNEAKKELDGRNENA